MQTSIYFICNLELYRTKYTLHEIRIFPIDELRSLFVHPCMTESVSMGSC